MSNKLRDKIDFTVFCVNAFARNSSLPYGQSFDYLRKYGALDLVVDFYDVNSTMPLALMIEDMRECCRLRGGTLV